MRRIWFLVIALAVCTAVVLAFTWQNIPYLNTWLVNKGVISMVSGVISSLTDVLNGKMPLTQVIPILTGAGTVAFAIIRQVIENGRRTRAEAQIKLTDMQSTVGSVKAMAKDTIDAVTGEKQKIEEAKASLEGELAAAKTVIDGKDEKIIEVQDALTKAQAEIIAKEQEILETTKKMDEYRIALKEKEKPTLN